MSRGGARKGAGRKAVMHNKQAAAFAGLVRRHTERIVDDLFEIATGSTSEVARIAAIRELLARGYGTASPPVDEESEPPIRIYRWATTPEEAIFDPARSNS